MKSKSIKTIATSVLIICILKFAWTIVFTKGLYEENQRAAIEGQTQHALGPGGKSAKDFERKYRNQLQNILEWIISPATSNVMTCAPNLTVTIFVHSEPHQFELRKAIRSTWGAADNLRKINMQLFFMIGRTEYRHSSPQLQREMRYRDVITLPIIENYRNLTLKTVAMLVWISKCCNAAKYYLKIDDDSYLNKTNFLNVVNKLSNITQPKNGLIYGSPLTGGSPKRDPNSKFYTSFLSYPKDVYPPYVCGAGYLLSLDSVYNLLRTVKDRYTPLITIEDVYISGIVREIANIDLILDDSFNQVYKSDGTGACQNCSKLVTIHRANPTRQYKLYGIDHKKSPKIIF